MTDAVISVLQLQNKAFFICHLLYLLNHQLLVSLRANLEMSQLISVFTLEVWISFCMQFYIVDRWKHLHWIFLMSQHYLWPHASLLMAYFSSSLFGGVSYKQIGCIESKLFPQPFIALSVVHLSWIMQWKSGGSKEVGDSPHLSPLHWGKLRFKVQESHKEI